MTFEQYMIELERCGNTRIVVDNSDPEAFTIEEQQTELVWATGRPVEPQKWETVQGEPRSITLTSLGRERLLAVLLTSVGKVFVR